MEYFFSQLNDLMSSSGRMAQSNTGVPKKNWLSAISSIGMIESMDDYEKRKLSVFNQLNFFQLFTSTIVPLAGLFCSPKFPPAALAASCVPPLISAAVFSLNSRHKYQAGLLCYFIFYPVFTCFIYLNGVNTGSELSFILYGVLSVLFLDEDGYIVFVFCLSIISYLVLFIFWKNDGYQPEHVATGVYLANQFLVIAYIFLALFLVKRENAGYQSTILNRSRDLFEKNRTIVKQREEIAGKAMLLEEQTCKLIDSNNVKTTLFSIISHDLKGPIFGLRNLFTRLKEKENAGETIKAMMPDILNELNGCADLIQNLLQWSKCQMRENTLRPRPVDLCSLTNETVRTLKHQSDFKKISIQAQTHIPVRVFADKDMLGVILRNLLSNAIKFTPDGGKIAIGMHETGTFIEVFVKDSGVGMSREQIRQINGNTFYNTRGTKNEQGTGMGLMLCREFILKNGGYLMIESKPGKGSTFSFTLPTVEIS